MKLLTEKQRKKIETSKSKIQLADKAKAQSGPKTKPLTKTAAVESLIITVQNAVQQAADTNQKTVSLIESMVVHLGRDMPAPVLQIDSQIVNMPDLPEVPIAQSPKRWKIKVSQRDNRGLIQEIDLERIE